VWADGKRGSGAIRAIRPIRSIHQGVAALHGGMFAHDDCAKPQLV